MEVESEIGSELVEGAQAEVKSVAESEVDERSCFSAKSSGNESNRISDPTENNLIKNLEVSENFDDDSEQGNELKESEVVEGPASGSSIHRRLSKVYKPDSSSDLDSRSDNMNESEESLTELIPEDKQDIPKIRVSSVNLQNSRQIRTEIEDDNDNEKSNQKDNRDNRASAKKEQVVESEKSKTEKAELFSKVLSLLQLVTSCNFSVPKERSLVFSGGSKSGLLLKIDNDIENHKLHPNREFTILMAFQTDFNWLTKGQTKPPNLVRFSNLGCEDGFCIFFRGDKMWFRHKLGARTNSPTTEFVIFENAGANLHRKWNLLAVSCEFDASSRRSTLTFRLNSSVFAKSLVLENPYMRSSRQELGVFERMAGQLSTFCMFSRAVSESEFKKLRAPTFQQGAINPAALQHLLTVFDHDFQKAGATFLLTGFSLPKFASCEHLPISSEFPEFPGSALPSAFSHNQDETMIKSVAVEESMAQSQLVIDQSSMQFQPEQPLPEPIEGQRALLDDVGQKVVTLNNDCYILDNCSTTISNRLSGLNCFGTTLCLLNYAKSQEDFETILRIVLGILMREKEIEALHSKMNKKPFALFLSALLSNDGGSRLAPRIVESIVGGLGALTMKILPVFLNKFLLSFHFLDQMLKTDENSRIFFEALHKQFIVNSQLSHQINLKSIAATSLLLLQAKEPFSNYKALQVIKILQLSISSGALAEKFDVSPILLYLNALGARFRPSANFGRPFGPANRSLKSQQSFAGNQRALSFLHVQLSGCS